MICLVQNYRLLAMVSILNSSSDLLIFWPKNNKIRVSVDLVSSNPGHNRHKIAARWTIQAQILRPSLLAQGLT